MQGHVDNTGEIVDRWSEGDSLWIKIAVDDDLLKYIVPKGFICIDGTSLTVCDVFKYIETSGGWFTIMLVSHTQQNVIFPLKNKGDVVNIEVDVLAKLVERSLANRINVLELRLAETEAKYVSFVKETEEQINELRGLIGNSPLKQKHCHSEARE